jgi:predicted MPP superfamily phosphohydrolase
VAVVELLLAIEAGRPFAMRPLIFFVALFIAVLNGGLCALQLGLLRRRAPWPRWLGAGVAGWTLLMVALFVAQIGAPLSWRPFLRHWFYFPLAVEMVWNLLFLQLLFLGTIVVTLVLRGWRPVRKSGADEISAGKDRLPADLSRRRFVYLLAFGAPPAAALAMGVHGTRTRYDLRVKEFRLAIPHLPAELEGFTIAHVSDLHSGIFCGPRRLALIGEATSDLKADLIVLTGDVINDHIEEFPDALAVIRKWRAPHGLYLCEGNHDLIPGRGLFTDACARAGLPLLINQTVVLPVENRRLILAGVPWLGRRFEVDPGIVGRLYPSRQEGDVRLLLAHHPHYLDCADDADLVLSGHTHGGQIMAGPIGLGPLFFKYWSGFYQRGNTAMIVSNGAGDWFPCRIGAPAEVGLVRLTRAA